MQCEARERDIDGRGQGRVGEEGKEGWHSRRIGGKLLQHIVFFFSISASVPMGHWQNSPRLYRNSYFHLSMPIHQTCF